MESRSEAESGRIRVLVVDDDDVLLRALQRVLVVQGFEVDTAPDGRAALRRLESNSYDVMLLDLRMGNMDGMEVYSMTRSQSAPATIIHSAHIDVETAVLATRAGVQDVMQKPVPEEALAARIRELALQRRAARAKPLSLPDLGGARESLSRLVGGSAPAAELREHVRRVAHFRDVSVMVQGATGTGKELVAQAIHALTCPDEPFVSVNCAAVPEQLIESELFGHEAGAFTNAKSPRVGLFEEAGRGTLFLDEIGEMPLALQAKLLRVLEIRQFRRVGGSRTHMLSARVVSATNRVQSASLGSAMRPDLYFRLAGYAIRTPSLLERMSDLPELARHFLYEFGTRHRMGALTISPAALDVLMAHHWPGNIRELRAVLENASIVARAGVLGRAEVGGALQARAGFSDLEHQSGTHAAVPRIEAYPASVELGGTAPRTGTTTEVADAPSKSAEISNVYAATVARPLRKPGSLPDLQRDLILRAFEGSQQNLSRAASELGIPRSTLRARLKRYGVR